MYVVWWSLAALMGVFYVVMEWKLWRAGVERVYGHKRVTLRGQPWQYRASAFLIGFLIFSGVFLGVMSYAGIMNINSVCWLSGAFLAGGINLINVGARLKYFDFDN